MNDVNPYIFFNGNCAEAMRFYEKTFGGRLNLLAAKESPMGASLPPEQANAVMHSHLDIDGGGILMASDWMSQDPYPGMHGFRVSLMFPTAADANRIFDALASGGSIQLPFQKTFWSAGFGMLTDRYGTPWMIGTDEGSEH
ncbi:MAG TPA: VOC family protein [Thermoanaerobaculia bacterium]